MTGRRWEETIPGQTCRGRSRSRGSATRAISVAPHVPTGGTSLIRNRPTLALYSRPVPRALQVAALLSGSVSGPTGQVISFEESIRRFQKWAIRGAHVDFTDSVQKSFRKSQFPHKSVNLSFITDIKNKLKNLCGN